MLLAKRAANMLDATVNDATMNDATMNKLQNHA